MYTDGVGQWTQQPGNRVFAGGSVCTQGTGPTPPTLAIDKHQAGPPPPRGSLSSLTPGSRDFKLAFESKKASKWISDPRGKRGLCGCWVLQRCPLMKERVRGPSRKGGQARPFGTPGLNRGRTRDQAAIIMSQPMTGLLHCPPRPPVTLKSLASTLPGAISSPKATARAPQAAPSWPETG